MNCARNAQKAAQAYYSDIAPRYEDLRPLDVDAVSVMSRRLPSWPPHGVEVCCGTGRYLRRVTSSRPPEVLTVGVDLNEGMLRTASLSLGDHPWPVRLVGL